MKLKCLNCGKANSSVYATRRCDCGCTQVPVSGRVKPAAKALYELGLPIKCADEFIVFDDYREESYYHSMIYVDFLKIVSPDLFFNYPDYALGREWDCLELEEMGIHYSRLLCSHSLYTDGESELMVRKCKNKNKEKVKELTAWADKVNHSYASKIFFLAGLL